MTQSRLRCSPASPARLLLRAGAAVLAAGALVALAAPVAFAGPGTLAGSTQSGGSTNAAGSGRVIVLGFDGADARTATQLMDRGELPHLAALRDKGTFAPLETTNPAESPVSWATLNSGQNPAKTGVPGFIRRDLIENRDKNKNRTPSPTFGHLSGPNETPIEELEGAPIPSWPPLALGAAVGAGAFLLFLGVFLLLRMRLVLALPLALVLGGASFFGGHALRRYLPSRIPVWNNPVESTPFWETAAAAGVPCVVLDAAQAFDREPVDGARVLAGLGVPDARGSVNSYFLFTSDETELYRAPRGRDTDSGGTVIRIDERGGRFDSMLPGPTNFWEIDRIHTEKRAIEAELDDPNFGGYQRSQELNQRLRDVEQRELKAVGERITVPLTIVRKGATADVTIGEHTESLSVGAWSSFYRLTFPLNPLLKVRALARAKLLELSDARTVLYVDALQYDPGHPPFWQPLSQPAKFARELNHAWGPYETVGWACMNLPLKDSVIDPVSFMQDIEFTLGWRERLTLGSLAEDDWRILMSCESTPDRVQHMMYRYYDPGHPLYTKESADQRMTFCGEDIALSDAIPASYRRMDAFVGEVVEKHLKPGDTLIVCSDHGFQSFRTQVHLNNWLLEKGYLVLRAKADEKSSDPLSDLNAYVDWSETRAYALGLGMIYVNLKGREGRGIVPKEQMRALLDSIAKDFLESVDPATGQKFGAGAYVMEDIHSGPHVDREADMLLCFQPGFRVSWLTTGGGIAGRLGPGRDIVADKATCPNDKNWSGDHVTVDPTLVRGIFFSNRKLANSTPTIDLRAVAPTVLSLVGVSIPKEYDLAPLAFER